MQEKFHDLLRDHGRSITRSRTRLFEYLQQSGPVSVSQFMRDNAAIADRASLYRTLIMFRELGVIEDRIIQGERLVELTDEYDSHHHHLTCRQCGRSVAITMPDIERELVELCNGRGFAVESHMIEVSGLCEECRMPGVQMTN
jgi:Fur family ferric uptake transcriptional regulator